MRAAAELRRALRDEVSLLWMNQLRDVADEALVAGAGALGLEARVGYSPDTVLAGYVADRRLLLVLDNCEHLVNVRSPTYR